MMGEHKRRTGTHGPVEEAYRQKMQAVGQALDDTFNPNNAMPKQTGFVLLVFPFGDAQSGRINYLSNGVRQDVVTAMKELLARFEGRHPEETQSGGSDLPQ
jgi:hypothetical protein